MRILVVTPWFPSAAHIGSGIFNLRDVQLLSAEHDVTVLHLIRPEWAGEAETEELVEGIHTVRVPYLASTFSSWGHARRMIRRHMTDADLLHTMAMPALLAMTGLGVPIPWVHTEHWSSLRSGAPGLGGVIARSITPLFRRPTELIAVSEDLADGLKTWSKRAPYVIGNAVPAPEPGVISMPRNALEPLRLIGVGGLTERKGALLAVESVALLRAEGVDADLVWVGSGEQQEQVEARIVELGIGGHVKLTGQLSREELEAELLRSHLFVLPTAGETFGVAIAEALACGLPVVTTGTGGHLQVVAPFAAAHVVDRTPQALVEGVHAVLRKDGLEQRQQTAALATERFSEETRQRAYREVYESAQRNAR